MFNYKKVAVDLPQLYVHVIITPFRTTENTVHQELLLDSSN